MFALFKVKNWSIFVCFFVFENLILPAERRGFLKNMQTKKTTKNTISKVKNWSNYVAQHNWTIFNFNLDQFLPLDVCFFLGGGGVWAETHTHIFIVFQQKKQNWKKHKKEKKTLFVNTPVLTVLVEMSVFFCISWFLLFWNFHVFQRCFW